MLLLLRLLVCSLVKQATRQNLQTLMLHAVHSRTYFSATSFFGSKLKRIVAKLCKQQIVNVTNERKANCTFVLCLRHFFIIFDCYQRKICQQFSYEHWSVVHFVISGSHFLE